MNSTKLKKIKSKRSINLKMRKTGLKAQETKEASKLIEIYMRMKDSIN